VDSKRINMFATDVTQMEEEGETKVMMWRKKGRK
jgi:hypothetical protein